MNKEEFVKAIKGVLRDGTPESFLNDYEKPPGRSPTKKTIRLSCWYQSLSPEQKEGFKEVIYDIVDSSIFGFFCILDGVRAISMPEDRWECELRLVQNENQLLLNDPDSGEEMLHDIYQGLTWSAD